MSARLLLLLFAGIGAVVAAADDFIFLNDENFMFLNDENFEFLDA